MRGPGALVSPETTRCYPRCELGQRAAGTSLTPGPVRARSEIVLEAAGGGLTPGLSRTMGSDCWVTLELCDCDRCFQLKTSVSDDDVIAMLMSS